MSMNAAVARKRAVDASVGSLFHGPALKHSVNVGGGPSLAALDRVMRGAGVQRKAAGDSAREGFGGSGSSVPHLRAMESSFGVDFSGVRAHVGTPQAKAAAHDLGAEAYAMDGQVAFRDANPSQAVVAHELTHVLQQGHGGPQRRSTGAVIATAGESQAMAVESAVSRGLPASSALSGGAAGGAEGVARKLEAVPGAEVKFTTDSAALSAGVSFNLPSTPIPLFTGVFLDVGGGFNLGGCGEVKKDGDWSVSAGGSASVSAGLALGIPNVMNGGFYATAGVGLNVVYEKKGKDTFVGIDFTPSITADVRITVGPGWWVKKFELANIELFKARIGFKNGKWNGFTFEWGEKFKAFIDWLKKVYEDAVGLVKKGAAAVQNAASTVWDVVTSW